MPKRQTHFNAMFAEWPLPDISMLGGAETQVITGKHRPRVCDHDGSTMFDHLSMDWDRRRLRLPIKHSTYPPRVRRRHKGQGVLYIIVKCSEM